MFNLHQKTSIDLGVDLHPETLFLKGCSVVNHRMEIVYSFGLMDIFVSYPTAKAKDLYCEFRFVRYCLDNKSFVVKYVKNKKCLYWSIYNRQVSNPTDSVQFDVKKFPNIMRSFTEKKRDFINENILLVIDTLNRNEKYFCEFFEKHINLIDMAIKESQKYKTKLALAKV